ncbi:MerR family transcriptional regulator [Lachnospiraceae bacterium OF09-33XD]|nr:MerR family transcriptional regulator [Lachnospiraceae bacterium OF09-33XD]
MKTVKEVSELTGISVRALHYYDEIGLFRPTVVSEAGYRLYDDKALERLQQILFFREFDMPLRDIKAVMDNPHLDSNQILQSQRQMLVMKKERLERLIASLDDILKGDNRMDFEVFSKEDIDKLYAAIVTNMPKEQLEQLAEQYGGLEQYEKHFRESAASENAQKNYAKMVEWYGDKESALKAAENPDNPQIIPAYQKRMDEVLKKLAARKGEDVTSFAVKEVVGEYDFVAKQLYQMKDVSAMMLEAAEEYQNNRKIQETLDKMYGEGAAIFISRAFEVFYEK